MLRVSGDLLAAASLLGGMAGLLYSTWHGDLEGARKVPIKPKAANRGPERDKVRYALARCAALTCATTALLASLTPPALAVIMGAVAACLRDGWDAFARYDAVSACFLITYMIILLLTVVLAAASKDLMAARKDLNQPDRH